MTKIIVFLLCSIVSNLATSSTANAATNDDPYSQIEHIVLPNGINVFLASSYTATLMSVSVEVDVGWEAEDPSNWGVSHLLEHTLFRDKELKDQMSYLQLIKEAGGQANGSTSARLTKYFGSIPAEKGTWMLKSFQKMILKPTINDSYVQKEKSTVEIEIGRPDPIIEMLGFQPLDYLKYFSYLSSDNFWETEFNYEQFSNSRFSRTDERLSNRRLTVAQVQKHYDNYYYPSNMRLFIAGKFDRQEVLDEINANWSSLPGRSGKSLPPEKPMKALREPYYRTKISGDPKVEIGVKVENSNIFEQEVLRSYFEYLTHRLMKEVRNAKGQTYTAYPETELIHGNGYSKAVFKTQREHFAENMAIVKRYLKEEAQEGKLSDNDIKSAIDLYLGRYKLCGAEADDMMKYASFYQSALRDYGKFESPYALLKEANMDEYRSTLKRLYNKDMHLEIVSEPNKLFLYDDILMFLALLFFGFRFCRKMLTKPFYHEKVRWMRKLKCPPFKIGEVFVFVLSIIVYFHFNLAIKWSYRQIPFLNSSVYFTEYLNNVLDVITMLISAQIFFSIFMKKLILMDSQIIVKSMSYYSFSIPLDEVKIISTRRFVIHSLHMWKKIKFRYFFYSPKFWSKGLYIETASGKGYFFSVTNPEAAEKELSGLKRKLSQQPQKEMTAA